MAMRFDDLLLTIHGAHPGDYRRVDDAVFEVSSGAFKIDNGAYRLPLPDHAPPAARLVATRLLQPLLRRHDLVSATAGPLTFISVGGSGAANQSPPSATDLGRYAAEAMKQYRDRYRAQYQEPKLHPAMAELVEAISRGQFGRSRILPFPANLRSKLAVPSWLQRLTPPR